MTEQQHSTDDLAAPWEAAIVYPDGRQPVMLTPPDGVPHAEAQAIAVTYAETATAEGGEVTTAPVRHCPDCGRPLPSHPSHKDALLEKQGCGRMAVPVPHVGLCIPSDARGGFSVRWTTRPIQTRLDRVAVA